MKETYEFQLYKKLDPQNAVAESGTADAVTVHGTVGDEQYRRIEKLDNELRRNGDHSAIAGWDIHRKYSAAEIENAELLLVKLRFAHAAGDEFGTEYTEPPLNPACGLGREQVRVEFNPFRVVREHSPDLRCGLGSRQVGPLRLPTRKALRSRDIFRLWSGEIAVSKRAVVPVRGARGARLLPIWPSSALSKLRSSLRSVPSGAELFARASELGVDLEADAFWTWIKEDEQVSLYERSLWEQLQSEVPDKAASGDFQQLVVESQPLKVSEDSVFGDNPFRPDSEERCKCNFGEVRGTRLLSALSVDKSSWDGADVCITDVFVGSRRGLFRPYRLLIVSKRLLHKMHQAAVRGVDFELQ